MNELTRICTNPDCQHGAEAQPLASFYYDRANRRYRTTCKTCYKKKVNAGNAARIERVRGDTAWALSALRIARQPARYHGAIIDDQLTPLNLCALMELQGRRCVVSHLPLRLPRDSELASLGSWKNWNSRLDPDAQLVVPVLVPLSKGCSLALGDCAFISTAIMGLYMVMGGIGMLTGMNMQVKLFTASEILEKDG